MTEDLVLLCYEKFQGSETKCHRFLLYNFLEKMAKERGYEINFVPEKSPYTNFDENECQGEKKQSDI